MKIYGLVQWAQFDNDFDRTIWMPDFETVELFTDETERDRVLLELDGPDLVNTLNNLKERWGGNNEYIDFENSISKFEWNGYSERYLFSFHNTKCEPVKDGPYVPFVKETGQGGQFWWQINAHFYYKNGQILNYFTDACNPEKK